MDLLLALEALPLIDDASDDLQLRPYYEHDLVACRQLWRPLVQRQGLRDALRRVTQDERELLEELLVDVDRLVAFDLVSVRLRRVTVSKYLWNCPWKWFLSKAKFVLS